MTTRILVLPGIGDIYWIAVGIEAFARRHGIALPYLRWGIWDFDGRRRGKGFVDRLPFSNGGDYFHRPPHPGKIPAFKKSYHTGEQSVWRSFLGFTWYLAVNGAIRNGIPIEQALEVEAQDLNWHLELRRTPSEIEAEQELGQHHGSYVAAHFSDFGIFKPWVKAWPAERCADLCRKIHQATGHRVLLTGCEWDQPFSRAVAALAGEGTVDLTGQTPGDRFYGMLRGARGVLGWCGGNTILATALRKPTLILWSREAFPNPAFYRLSCPPDTWERTYQAAAVEGIDVEEAATRYLEAARYESI